MAMPIRPVLEIDIILDSFICTVHATVSAVAGDTDLVRVNRLKLYLLTAIVPVILWSRLGTRSTCQHNRHKLCSLPRNINRYHQKSLISARSIKVTENNMGIGKSIYN